MVKTYDFKIVFKIEPFLVFFDEWFDPQEDLEVISLDEISKDQYDDFVDHKNQ